LAKTFDLFDKLGATEDQLDFPVVFASALNGFAMLDATKPGTDMRPLYEAIIKHTPQPDVDAEKPLQLQICSLDYSRLCRPYRDWPHQAGAHQGWARKLP